jgi:2,4-dienoyl-CoA reductase-like NADH-dependent reductase (Old Yellow Enzyme family)
MSSAINAIFVSAVEHSACVTKFLKVTHQMLVSQPIKLFSSLTLRNVEFPNRVMISPMSQYSAVDGFVQDWHRDHVAMLAKGGAGSVMLEATAITRDGRGTVGDLGIWHDAHVDGLAELARTIERNGAVAAIQIGHAGRKASCQRPWEGYGPLHVDNGEAPWQTWSSSELPVTPQHAQPAMLNLQQITELVAEFASAASRARRAGFRLIELHAAHGYLLHSFMSPLVNTRQDEYGGDINNRIKFPLQVIRAVREAIGEDLALSVRVSAVDGLEGGWDLDDTVAFAKAAQSAGADIIDCSSGGIAGGATASNNPNAVKRGPGFQVPFARAVKQEAGVPSIAVGLITHALQAEEVLKSGSADIIAIGREALLAPNWPLNAQRALTQDRGFTGWPQQYGWWLARSR